MLLLSFYNQVFADFSSQQWTCILNGNAIFFFFIFYPTWWQPGIILCFQGIRKRMTCSEFIENLAELNDGENYYKEVLKCIYHAIKTDQIEWAV